MGLFLKKLSLEIEGLVEEKWNGTFLFIGRYGKNQMWMSITKFEKYRGAFFFIIIKLVAFGLF